MMGLGLYTFADVGPEIGPARRLRNLIEEIELADRVGLDVFGVLVGGGNDSLILGAMLHKATRLRR